MRVASTVKSRAIKQLSDGNCHLMTMGEAQRRYSTQDITPCMPRLLPYHGADVDARNGIHYWCRGTLDIPQTSMVGKSRDETAHLLYPSSSLLSRVSTTIKIMVVPTSRIHLLCTIEASDLSMDVLRRAVAGPCLRSTSRILCLSG